MDGLLTFLLLLCVAAMPAHALVPGQVVEGRCSHFRLERNAAIYPDCPTDYYAAARWDYRALARHWNCKRSEVKARLRECLVYVHNPETERVVYAVPADWGPAKWTGRTIDLSKQALRALGARTDDKLRFGLVE